MENSEAQPKRGTQPKPLSNLETADFCRQFSQLNSSDTMPIEIMDILLEDTHDTQGQLILRQIRGNLAAHDSLSDAIAKTGVFPDYCVKLIAVGETTGKLSFVTSELADYYEREDRMSENIRSAVSYPILMILIMFAVVIILLTRVLPVFEQVYAQLGSEMTGVSGSLMAMSRTFSRSALVFAVLFAVFVALYFWFAKTRRGRTQLAGFLYSFPLTRSYADSAAAARFADGFTLVLETGTDVYAGIELAAQTSGSATLRRKAADCRKLLSGQLSVSDALVKSGIFSPVYARMISIGFKSGRQDEVIRTVARRYREESERKLDNMISFIEPTLVIVLSVIVGLILLSVILPLMGIMSGIG
ncbi:MAG: type II secretion system F family protein [Lachnospiraceae bacterium]|jgi:type IV pilus assembly protein PilC|nr:type II secretion system F family protein [Lachnospiraceae bacterium]